MKSNPIIAAEKWCFIGIKFSSPHNKADVYLRAALIEIFKNQKNLRFSFAFNQGGRRSPAVACWASDHWVASSNPLRGKCRH